MKRLYSSKNFDRKCTALIQSSISTKWLTDFKLLFPKVANQYGSL